MTVKNIAYEIKKEYARHRYVLENSSITNEDKKYIMHCQQWELTMLLCSKLICKCLKYFCSNQKFNLKTITIKLDYYKKLLGCRSLQRSVQNQLTTV